jgi:hypothetical protein
MFCLWIDGSTMNSHDKTYQAVKKCEEETQIYGRKVLENDGTCMKRNKAGDKMMAQLRTDLFLDLCIGQEVGLTD